MPAPAPGTIERSLGVAEWGAEIEAQPILSEDEIYTALIALARPEPTNTTKAAMCDTLAVAARAHDLPVGFFVRLINQESGFNPEAVSPVGAQGVAQFMPKVAEEWNLKNPFDPHAALVASARFLRSLYEQFGNWGLAAAAYNGGMGRVQKWIDKRGKLPDETRHYVKTITGLPAEQWANGKPRGANFSIHKRLPCQEIAHLAAPVEEIPLPRARAELVVAAAPQGGPSPKLAAVPATVKVTVAKGGTKVAVIAVKEAPASAGKGRKAASKVAAVNGKIAAPAPIMAGKAAPAKGKKTKLAEKAKPAGKTKAAAAAKADKKSGKGRVQVADAQAARK